MRRRVSDLRPVYAVAFLAIMWGCGGGGPESSNPNTAAPVANPVNPSTAGSITGKVTFEGAAPPRVAIKMSADPNCERAGQGVTTEGILVGSGGALENVFVYVKDGLGNLRFPTPSTPAVLDQKGCHYTPHVFGVQVGQPVEIVNSDATLHNVHAVATSNQEFNTGQPIQGMRFTHTFSTTEVMVPVKCDVHGWMNAYVGVLDHPFFAVSSADGTFSLKGLPPGNYTIEAWHEKLGTQMQMVTIGEKETKNVAFAFKLPT